MNQPNCLYFLEVPSGHCKIGIATNPWSRMRDLQTGNHEKIALRGAWEFDGQTARAVEREIHSMLKTHHRFGEWFKVNVETAINMMKPAYESIASECKICGEKHYGLCFHLPEQWPKDLVAERQKEPIIINHIPPFDRVKYQREYMRKRRAKTKDKLK